MQPEGTSGRPDRRLRINPFDRRLGLRPESFEITSLTPRDNERFELDFLEGVVAEDPCNEDALILLGSAYSQRGDYEKGLRIDRRLVRLRPGDPTAYYNLACSYALLTRVEDAFLALERAVALGYRDVAHMLKDRDLTILRDDPRFRSFVTRILSHSSANS